MKRICLSLLIVAVTGTAHAQNRPNVVIMREEVNVVGTSAGVIGPYRQVIGEYLKSLEKYPNPRAVNMTQFGGAK